MTILRFFHTGGASDCSLGGVRAVRRDKDEKGVSTPQRVGKDRASWLLFSRVNRSFIKKIFHDVLFRNRFALQQLWGLEAPALYRSLPYGANYADLTTLLLRWTLGRWIQTGNIHRLHEIGIGHYGILCLYLKRTFPRLGVSGSTISPTEVENATAVSRLNGVEPNYFVSDVLAAFDGTADMMWWNLPYYQPQCLSYLRTLRDQITEKGALRDGGLLVLGYNSIPLDAEQVQAVFAASPHFVVKRVEKFFWNPHLIVTFEFRSRRT